MKNTIKKKQWHPAFCSAIKLELRENKDILDYTNEYNINTKPIEVDLLIIKKPGDAAVHNELGRIFRGHNIVEYKSPGDHLDIDILCKVLGYAYLYKAKEPHKDEIALDDITITLVRKSEPSTLLKELNHKFHFNIENPYNGIYYINKDGFFPIQIVISKKLDKHSHIWLTSLTDAISETDARKLVQEADALYEKEDRDYADSVLQLSVQLNKNTFALVKGEQDMCEAIRELFKDEIDEEIRIATEKVTEEVTKEVTKVVSERSKIRIFINMIVHGYSKSEAQKITEITNDQVVAAMELIG